jgi:hypothetical protein
VVTGKPGKTTGKQSVVVAGSTNYGPRLPQGTGILQQLKDLAVLGSRNNIARIERNFLITAMTLNLLSTPSASEEDDEEVNKLISMARYVLTFVLMTYRH